MNVGSNLICELCMLTASIHFIFLFKPNTCIKSSVLFFDFLFRLIFMLSFSKISENSFVNV